jgi:hypothetical protein
VEGLSCEGSRATEKREEGLCSGACLTLTGVTAVASRTYIPTRRKARASLLNPFDGHQHEPRKRKTSLGLDLVKLRDLEQSNDGSILKVS